MPILSLMTFVPLAGMVAVLALPRKADNLVRWTSVVATGIPLILSIILYLNFDRTTAGMQFVERVAWIPMFNIEYYMGIDGLSVPMVLLTALLSFLCVFASWDIND